jgi:hypothetical protein
MASHGDAHHDTLGRCLTTQLSLSTILVGSGESMLSWSQVRDDRFAPVELTTRQDTLGVRTAMTS